MNPSDDVSCLTPSSHRQLCERKHSPQKFSAKLFTLMGPPNLLKGKRKGMPFFKKVLRTVADESLLFCPHSRDRIRLRPT